jgi:hypothetical protein
VTPGRWRVWTEHSCYLVDLHEGWIERESDAGLGLHPRAASLPPLPERASELRRDRVRIPLLEMYRCEVGEPMLMLLQIRDDGVTTLRRTTFVHRKEPV